MSFKIIVISSPTAIPAETEKIIALFRAGLKIFHLRKPGMSKAGYRKLLGNIPPKYHSRIVLHAHHSLANEFKVRGIHFTEKERKKDRGERNKRLKYSASLHAVVDVFLCRNAYDYVFISPVFDSISKKHLESKFELEILSRFFAEYCTLPGRNAEVIALGGVNEKNVRKVFNAGFHGAALLGAIWQSKDPVKNFLKIGSKITE
ncbi:MAG TPA: thiamine phosphate synthase [Bacteroidia bacterium]|jgi:thiamine-phosphate pyrophosphorylase